MPSGLISIALTGTRAAQAQLAVTGHNITNATTAGYHRQEAIQTASVVTNFQAGSGYFGSGTQIDNVKRAYNQVVENQVLVADTRLSYFKSYNNQVQQIDNMTADADMGISTTLQDFFKGVNEVVAYPGQQTARQSFMGQANALATRFNAMYGRFEQMRNDNNNQLTYMVNDINGYAKKLADINDRIAGSARGTEAQKPNDLYDLRDSTVAELNKLVGVKAFERQDGTVDVYFGKGQTLVLGAKSMELTAKPSTADAERYEVYYKQYDGMPDVLVDSKLVEGGQLGGLLEFRDNTLDVARNGLGRVAIGLADAMNKQNAKGVDLTGNQGGALFQNMTSGNSISGPGPKVIPNDENNPASGMPTVTIADTSKLTTRDYKFVATASNPNGWTAFDAKTGEALTIDTTAANIKTTGAAFTIDGLDFTPPSPMADADSFIVRPTYFGARDFKLTITDPSKVAAAVNPAIQSATTNNINTALPSLIVTDLSSFQGSGSTKNIYQVKYTVTAGVGTWAAYDSTGTSLGDPTAAVIPGLTFTAPSSVANGDTFIIDSKYFSASSTSPYPITPNPTSDNTNMKVMADLQAKQILGGGTMTFNGAYANMVNEVGVAARDMQIGQTAQEGVLDAAKQQQQELSGVNLDEEAANLVKYQQAYQASAKIIQMANQIFDSILSIVN